MNFINKIVVLLLFISQIIFSQSTSFNSKLNQLSNALENVENGKSMFDLSISSPALGVATFTDIETTKKGKVKDATYEFNFADIDINTVRYITSKDIIKVQLIVKQNQRMIKFTKDKEEISYVKELIPISNQITENRLSLKGYDDSLNWLIKNVFSVELEDEKIEQALIKENSYPASVALTNTNVKSKSVSKKTYKFNFTNINERGISLKK